MIPDAANLWKIDKETHPEEHLAAKNGTSQRLAFGAEGDATAIIHADELAGKCETVNSTKLNSFGVGATGGTRGYIWW